MEFVILPGEFPSSQNRMDCLFPLGLPWRNSKEERDDGTVFKGLHGKDSKDLGLLEGLVYNLGASPSIHRAVNRSCQEHTAGRLLSKYLII
jgi:hypothetical protein